jgi:hypothetical protein
MLIPLGVLKIVQTTRKLLVTFVWYSVVFFHGCLEAIGVSSLIKEIDKSTEYFIGGPRWIGGLLGVFEGLDYTFESRSFTLIDIRHIKASQEFPLLSLLGYKIEIHNESSSDVLEWSSKPSQSGWWSGKGYDSGAPRHRIRDTKVRNIFIFHGRILTQSMH